MKKLLTFFAAAAVLASAAEYQIDPTHSAAQFSVKHLMVSKVRGQFSKVTGTVSFDPQNLKASSIKATIDMNTVDTRDPQRDGHLKSPDFFDVAKFPTMTFESTKLYQEGGKLKAAGNLTIKGVTKPVVLTIDGPGPEVKDPWGNLRLGASASTVINRQDFGVTWNKNLDGGGVMLSDEVAIDLDIEITRKPDAPKSGR